MMKKFDIVDWMIMGLIVILVIWFISMLVQG